MILLAAGTLILVAFDQVTKLYVARNITSGNPVVIFENFFEFTYVLNPGAAFGLFAGNESSFRHTFFVTITLIAIGFVLYTFFTLKDDFKLIKVSLCLILSGAVGNFIDRLRLHAVIDFISVHYYNYHWPAFNIADALITVGVFLMAFDIIMKGKKEREAKR